jgi:hypothetical protein
LLVQIVELLLIGTGTELGFKGCQKRFSNFESRLPHTDSLLNRHKRLLEQASSVGKPIDWNATSTRKVSCRHCRHRAEFVNDRPLHSSIQKKITPAMHIAAFMNSHCPREG